MSPESLHLDIHAYDSSQRILPVPPLVASKPDVWPFIQVELHRQPPHHTPTHTSNAITLCLHTGEPIDMEWWIDGKYETGTVSYHQMTLFPSMMERAIRWREEKAFLLLCLPENFTTEILGHEQSFAMTRLVPQLGVHDPFIREIGQLFRHHLEHHHQEYSLYIESLSLTLGVYLAQHYSESSFTIRENHQGLSASQVRQVKDYIDAHLGDPIRLKDMAQLLGMSAFHFSRQFKEATQIPPYQFVMNTRINRAKELLQSASNFNISDIASRCGFSNQSHFAYHFRKAEGLTPKKYRQNFE